MTQPPFTEGETHRDLTEMVNKQDILVLIDQELYSTEGNAHQRSYNKAVYDIIGLIKDYHQPEAQAGGEWISVETALPEIGKRVLVIDDDGDQFIDIRMGNILDESPDDRWEFYTHWMPLPEKPTPK